MAHYIVDAGAHTFGEAFVHEGGGDGVVVCGEAIHHMVNFGCGHAFANVLGEIIQQGRVDFGACADTGQLLLGAECASHRQFISFFLIMLNFGFYFVGIVFRSKPDSFHELFHCLFFFMRLQKYTIMQVLVLSRAEKTFVFFIPIPA